VVPVRAIGGLLALNAMMVLNWDNVARLVVNYR
jgi:hypothetical protein